jgi:replicative DNA helicase
MTTTQSIETFHFDDSFQQGILQLMMSDSTFCLKASVHLKPEYFKNQYYGYFFSLIAKLFQEFNQPPTGFQVVNEMIKIKMEERPPYTALFEKIIKPTMSRDFDYIRSRLEYFVKRAKMWQINQKMVQNKFSDPDTLYQFAHKEFSEMENTSFAKDDYVTLSDADRILIESANVVTKLVPTGLPTIDKAMGGGLPRGTLTTFIGGTNVGKSIVLINLANHLIKTGYKVLYVNLEGEKNQPMLRLISRGTKVKYGRVRNNHFDDNELVRKNNFIKKYGHNLRLKHVNTFNYTVEDLFAYARHVKEEFDFDALLVDYGQLLGAKQKQEGLRHTMAYVHRALASMAGALDAALVTVAQGTRDVQEKNRKGTDLLRMNDISECFEIIRVSAQVFTINRSDSDEQNDRCRILLDKQRDGKKGIIEICKTDIETISMYGPLEDGLGFLTPDEYLQEELDRVSTEQGADGTKSVSLN